MEGDPTRPIFHLVALGSGADSGWSGGLHVGSTGVGFGSMRVFGYQYVGIGNGKSSCRVFCVAVE